MKIIEHIAQAKSTLISLEVLPPVRGTNIEQIFKHIDPLMEFNPSFINVTYHRSEQTFKKQQDGTFKRIEVRKRPGTVGICAAIMNRYNIDAVPHLICGGFTKEETENALIDLHYLGINNVLALRGDAPSNERFFSPIEGGHSYACDLVNQIQALNNGQYLEEDTVNGGNTDFCIGVAGYPEKHAEAANMEMDLYYLSKKIEAGAQYITTQMFFENKKYHEYILKCNNAGIQVPIIPGIKPITNLAQLSKLPSIFNIDIPQDLAKAMLACKTSADVEKIGTEWLIAQCKDLIAHNVPVLHFYTLGKPTVIYNVLKAIL